MPSRRSGTRSHHGCQNCKARHVKCDETFPTCTRCQRRNEVCTLSLKADMLPHGDSPIQAPTQTEQAQGIQNKQKLDGVPTAQQLVDGGNTYLDNTWLDDMLLDHFITVASFTLSEKADITAVYHDTAPLLAPRHDHLKHALLSISGAHCVATLTAPDASQTVSSQTVHALIERSLTHQSLALNTFVRAITAAKSGTLSKEEGVALTLSSILVLTSFIAHLHPAFHKPFVDVGALSKAVALLNLQGPIVVFFAQYHEQIAASELAVFIHLYPDEDPSAPVHSQEAAKSLERVALLCQQQDLSPIERQKYAEVVDGLDQMSRSIAADPFTIGSRFRWVVGDTATYMANKIYQRVPEALILLAHWAACQIPNPGSWFASGYGEALVTEIERALPPAYAAYIEWPLAQLRQAHL